MTRPGRDWSLPCIADKLKFAGWYQAQVYRKAGTDSFYNEQSESKMKKHEKVICWPE